MGRKIDWRPEHKEFLEKNIKGRSYAELVEMFNAEFQLDLAYGSIKGLMVRNGLRNGRDTRFNSEHIPHNKGVKGVRNSPGTEFKKGKRPHNWVPVGSQRVNRDGYAEVKIAEPRTWKGKHLLVWEEAHGPVPKGHVVIFGDKNKSNFDIENLVLVSRAQLVRMNQHSLIQDDADLTRTGAVLADVLNRIGEVKRRRRRRNK